jgi:ATP-dependent Clp protease ATP-binding subunit ClpC
LTAAVVLSSRLLKNHCLPDKAIDVIDDAGACVKVVREKQPCLKRWLKRERDSRFISRRHEAAMTNHEFEKARLLG